MTVETSKKILKIFGIISIIFGVIGVIVGILGIAGGGLMASTGVDEAVGVGAIALVLSVIVLVSAIVSLLDGIFSVRAAKDSSKIMPAWVFAIIGLVLRVISLFTNLKSGTSAIVGRLFYTLPRSSAFSSNLCVLPRVDVVCFWGSSET